MRYKNLLLFVAVIVAIAGVAMALGSANATARGQGGSYRETCRNIETRGSTLYADCRDAGSNWHRTELRDYDRCRGEIQNLNGNLTCAGQGGNAYGRDHDHDGDHDRDHDRNGVPPGSYSQTCQNIHVDGNRLSASCQKKNGSWRDTSLNNFRSCREIENNNGKLKCR